MINEEIILFDPIYEIELDYNGSITDETADTADYIRVYTKAVRIA